MCSLINLICSFGKQKEEIPVAPKTPIKKRKKLKKISFKKLIKKIENSDAVAFKRSVWSDEKMVKVTVSYPKTHRICVMTNWIARETKDYNFTIDDILARDWIVVRRK